MKTIKQIDTREDGIENNCEKIDSKHEILENFSLKDYKIEYHINLQECEQVVEWIQEENTKNGKHMLEKNAEELFNQPKGNACCILKLDNKLIGFINAMKVKYKGIELIETGSMIVDPQYQKKWIGFLLKKNLLEQLSIIDEMPIYSVTNQIATIKINKKLQQHKYKKEEAPKKILEVMESVWELLVDDSIYVNEVLHNMIQSQHLD